MLGEIICSLISLTYFGRGVRLCLYSVNVKRVIVIEHYNSVSWIQTEERVILFLFLLSDKWKNFTKSFKF